MDRPAFLSVAIVVGACLMTAAAVAREAAPACGPEASGSAPSKVFALSLTRGSRVMIDAKINGRALKALLDSAAEATLIDRGVREDAAAQGRRSSRRPRLGTLHF